LDNERAELSKNIERLKDKLDKAESLVFSMGTPEAIRQRGPVMGTSAKLFPRLFSSSSQDDHNKVGAPEGAAQNLVEPVDLSVSPTEPGDTGMETSTAPVIKLSFKEIISSVQKQNKATKNIEGLAGASEQPTPPRLITLSTIGNKNEDTVGKRARSMGTLANEPAAPRRNPLRTAWHQTILTPNCSKVRCRIFAHEIRTKRRRLKKSGGLVRTYNGHAGRFPTT
jgi:hypothetical protein